MSSFRKTIARILTPSRLLFFFTFAQTLIYYDRGLIAGFLPAVRESVGVANDSGASGLIGSVFILGYMIACPIFAYFGRSYSPYELMSLGLGLWILGIIFCASSNFYSLLLIGRSLTGVGEASFAGLAPTSIDDVAPKRQRTLWLGIFYCAIPIGTAIGYVFGGIFARTSWRIGFVLEAILMLPFASLTYFITLPTWKDITKQDEENVEETQNLLSNDKSIHDQDASSPTMQSSSSSSSPALSQKHNAGQYKDNDIDYHPHATSLASESQPLSLRLLLSDIKLLFTNFIFIMIALGYACLTFVIGALSFWGPADFSTTLSVSLQYTTNSLGIITFVCGLLGTFFGGWFLDFIGAGRGMEMVAASMRLSTILSAASFFAAILAFSSSNVALTMTSVALADFCLFATGAPVPAAILSVAPLELRSFAMAMTIFIMHCLGDMPSPFILGLITDRLGNIRNALFILCIWLCLAVLFWYLAYWKANQFAQNPSGWNLDNSSAISDKDRRDKANNIVIGQKFTEAPQGHQAPQAPQALDKV